MLGMPKEAVVVNLRCQFNWITGSQSVVYLVNILSGRVCQGIGI